MDHPYDTFTASVWSDRSFSDETNRLVTGDIPIFLGALLIMAIYLSFTLGNRFNCVEIQTWIGSLSVLIMLLAMISSLGLCGYFGIPSNTLVLLVPYILLGIGIDDMIIIMDSFHHEIHSNNDQNIGRDVLLARALSISGVSVTLTSLSSVAAFAVGAASPILAIESFCGHAAFAFLANDLLQFLLLVPCIVFDRKRIDNRRNFCFFCFTHGKTPPKSEQSHSQMVNTSPKLDEFDTTLDLDLHENGSHKKSIFEKFNILNFIDSLILPILNNRIGRWSIILVFIGLSIGGMISLDYVNTNASLAKLVPDDSYVLDFLDARTNAFKNLIPDAMGVFPKNIDFSDKNEREKVYNMVEGLENMKDSIGTMTNFLEDFEDWYLGYANESIDNIEDSPQFYSFLKNFSSNSTHGKWGNKIIYDDFENPTMVYITSWELHVFQPKLRNDQWFVSDGAPFSFTCKNA